MGRGLTTRGLLPFRLEAVAISRARRRVAADPRLLLRQGAGERRDRAALRRQRGKFFGLVFRASLADRARAIRRNPEHDRQGGWRRRQPRRKTHSRPHLALPWPAPS